MNSVVRLGVFGALVFFALAGCSSSDDEPDWQYDQGDMEGVVFGTWAGTLTLEGGEPRAMTLEIRSHDESVRQLECGSRNFTGGDATRGLGVRCVEVSSLKVSATLTNGQDSISEDLDGSFDATGTTLDWAELYLGSPETGHVSARWERGAWTYCELSLDEATHGVCTLDERVD
jgi:hypothetical protein